MQIVIAREHRWNEGAVLVADYGPFVVIETPSVSGYEVVKDITVEDVIAGAKEMAVQNLVRACDEKQSVIDEFILGVKGTPGQLERYKLKYEMALNDELSAEEKAAVISKHEDYLKKKSDFLVLIEYFRQQIQELIDNCEFQRALLCIDAGREMADSESKESIDSMITNTTIA